MFPRGIIRGMAWDSEGQRRLCRLLQKSGMKQYEIAAHCHVEQATVSRWVTGQRKPTRFRHLQSLAELGIPHRTWDEAPVSENLAA